MKNRSKRVVWFVAFVLASACTEQQQAPQRVLPILGERDVVYTKVDGEEQADTLFHTVPDFSYLNQDSIWVHAQEMKEKVWVADFFFSHCPTICPPMTSQMKRLRDETDDLSEKVVYLSFSIDPERDTPSRLREYIRDYGINDKNWHFLTGEEEATHLLAKEFFNGAERNDGADGGFGHTDYFALVDTAGHVRGIYQGTDPDQVDRLQVDLRKLLKHEYNFIGTK